MGNFFAELKRRHMYRVAAAYAVVAWLLLQIVNNVAPGLNLPNWAITLVIVLLAIGFPVALLFCWIQHLPDDGAAQQIKTNRLDWILVGGLATVIAIFLFQQFAQQANAPVSQAPSPVGAISIAVLPFANVSGDASQEFFSDGMTDEIIAALAKVPRLQVVARTSAFQFKGERRDTRAIGQALNARYLIDGSVRKAGDRVRITAQLVQADNGVGVWTDSYDRELKDIFATQSDIAQAIAGALRLPLGLQQADALVPNRAPALEIYDDFLRARAQLRARGAATADAAAILERLVARDPDYAPAWALLGRAYSLAPINNPVIRGRSTEDIREAAQAMWERTERIAKETIRLDSRNALGYSVLARTEVRKGNWAAAEDLYRHALELDANEPEVLDPYRNMLAGVGRIKDALDVSRRLRELEPFVPAYNLRYASILQTSGQIEASISILEMIPPDSETAGRINRNVVLARGYATLGRYTDAANALRSIRNGNEMERRTGTAAAELLDSAPTKVDAPESLPYLEAGTSFAYVHVGALERTLEYPERLLDVGNLPAAEIEVLWRPELAPLRKLERFKVFVRNAGLVDYWRARGWPDLCRPVGTDDFECD
jgi:TolB-like protein